RRAPDPVALGQEKRREPAANDARRASQENTAHGTLVSLAPAPSSPQIFVEPIERSLPRLFRRGLIVAGGRVVVEAVVGVLVDVALMGDAGAAERRVERRPAAGDARVELSILGVDRRLDFRRVGRVRLQSIEWNGGVEA